MPSFIFGLNAEDPQGFDKDTYAPFNNITQGGGISNLKLLGQMDLNKWELFCTEQMRDLLLINNWFKWRIWSVGSYEPNIFGDLSEYILPIEDKSIFGANSYKSFILDAMGGKITSNRLLIFSQLDDCKYFFTQESDGVNDLEVYVEDWY